MSVFISNLDDFIAPGAACVNPLVLGKSSKDKEEDGAGKEVKAPPHDLQQGESASLGGLRIELGQGLEYESHIPPILAGEANLIRNKVSTSSSGSATKVATISLNDCLACSGCVTSAESVLIEQQSTNKLISKLAEQQAGDGDLVVVAMSPQSRAAIASRLGISSGEAFLRIASVLKGMGVRYVVDVASAADIALIEAREEFLLRNRLSSSGSSNPAAATQGSSSSNSNSGSSSSGSKAYWEKPPTTVAHSSTRLKVIPANASAQDFEQLQPTYVGAPPLPSSSLLMSSSAEAPSGENAVHMQNGDHSVTMPMPMIVSSCPGWVCYAEKTQPQVLPYMSSVKSAQQILGCLLKRQLGVTGNSGNGIGGGSEGNGDSSGNVRSSSSSSGGDGKRLFLVSIQPCFDKKLEASRLDFYDEEAEQADVDLVLSTTELWDVLLEKAAAAAAAGVVPAPTGGDGDDDELLLSFLQSVTPDRAEGRDETERLFRCYSADGAKFMSAVESRGSGGYLEYVMRYATASRQRQQQPHSKLGGSGGNAAVVAAMDVDNEGEEKTATAADDDDGVWSSKPLEYVSGRNADIAEVREGGFKFAKIYGFRNIQSLMLKLRRGKCDYDFVEVMACPSGCTNGGGQLRSKADSTGSSIETTEQTRSRVAATELTLADRDNTALRSPDESPLALLLYSPGQLSHPLSEGARALLHTRFHNVPKIEELAPLAAKW